MSELLRAEDVRLSYGQSEVLRGVSLTFGEPGSVAITGPSGSGKTSLLYALSGLERDVTGSVTLLGKDILALTPDELADLRLANVGFVFQSSDLVPELTLRQNIALPLQLAGLSRRAVSARVEELLVALGLTESADRRPNQVSGGQAQRCAVARAVVARPRVVFADEPTGALDQSNRDVVLHLLLQQVQVIGGLLLAVTHDPQVAARFDRVVSLSDGRVVTQASAPTGVAP
jgi:putative ABC transport system ATP-binding protein